MSLGCTLTFSAVQPETDEEWGPIIAVMAQPLGNATDYLPASYVKWLELGGARVVPVMYEATDREVDAIFANTNGLLLIGGDAPVCSAARRFLANAVSAAKGGDAYPIWGTCDGFEWLMQMAAKDDGALQPGFDTDQSLAVTLTLTLTLSLTLSLTLTLTLTLPLILTVTLTVTLTVSVTVTVTVTLTRFDSENLPLPLELTAAAAGSRLLADAGGTMAQRSPRLSVLEA